MGYTQIHCASQNDDGQASYLHKASFTVDGTSMMLISASKHTINETMPGANIWIHRIFGIL